MFEVLARIVWWRARPFGWSSSTRSRALIVRWLWWLWLLWDGSDDLRNEFEDAVHSLNHRVIDLSTVALATCLVVFLFCITSLWSSQSRSDESMLDRSMVLWWLSRIGAEAEALDCVVLHGIPGPIENSVMESCWLSLMWKYYNGALKQASSFRWWWWRIRWYPKDGFFWCDRYHGVTPRLLMVMDITMAPFGHWCEGIMIMPFGWCP